MSSLHSMPFRGSMLVGWDRWTSDHSERLGVNNHLSFYHACHLKQLEKFYDQNELSRRSPCSVRRALGEYQEFKGVWTSLQPWHKTHDHNHYGPFTIKMPISHLEGRRFVVFRRRINGR